MQIAYRAQICPILKQTDEAGFNGSSRHKLNLIFFSLYHRR